jgi:antitoxin (DNA-binding transcriptional repressor) of toxin-antitoxin stability system
MKSVGVKQLKSRLSEYLRLVKQGEVVLVTDRDEVVAELRPARRNAPTADTVEEVLEALAERGEIMRAATPGGGRTWRAKGLSLPPGSAQAVLDEIREDRGW